MGVCGIDGDARRRAAGGMRREARQVTAHGVGARRARRRITYEYYAQECVCARHSRERSRARRQHEHERAALPDRGPRAQGAATASMHSRCCAERSRRPYSTCAFEDAGAGAERRTNEGTTPISSAASAGPPGRTVTRTRDPQSRRRDARRPEPYSSPRRTREQAWDTGAQV